MDNRCTSKKSRIIFAGLLIGTLSVELMVGAAHAKSNSQTLAQSTATPQVTNTPTPTEPVVIKECIECHPDVKDAWITSPHALAFDNSSFQEGWASMDRPNECLLCHTTNYQEATGEYTQAGVSCEACHGAYNPDHPAVDYPVRSDQEYCGTCHPSTLGETQLSGHTAATEARCVNCHDPHGQGVMFENPDDMCKDCHKEDLAAMDKIMGDLHLRENITCADCHTLDIPHTFLYNFRQEDMTAFMAGFDCPSEISANLAHQTESKSNEQVFLENEMNWPTVHRVSRARSALKCMDCHEMDENLRADFKSLGYSDEDINKLTWKGEDFPAITDDDLNLLVSKPKRGWSWIFWLLGVALIFAIFEIFVFRKLRKHK